MSEPSAKQRRLAGYAPFLGAALGATAHWWLPSSYGWKVAYLAAVTIFLLSIGVAMFLRKPIIDDTPRGIEQ